MPRRSFRDRFFTPPVARAVTSPSGILLAGATASAGILIGLPLAGVLAVGAAAFAAHVVVAVPRDGHDGPRIDPSSLRDPWRRFFEEALDARRRFDGAVRHARSGPMRDRFSNIASRIDHCIDDCWRIAREGQALTDADKQLDADDAARQLRLLDARLAEAVARAIELSVHAADDAELSALSDDVDGLVGDLEALRQGMEETARPAAGSA
jgi:hypothetical protein